MGICSEYVVCLTTVLLEVFEVLRLQLLLNAIVNGDSRLHLVIAVVSEYARLDLHGFFACDLHVVHHL